MNRTSISMRVLALLFALLLVLPALGGCNNEKNPGSDTTEETVPEKNEPFLFGDGIAVVRGDSSTAGETSAAERLAAGIEEKTGTALKLKTDRLKAGTVSTAQEILVGNTNRPEAEGLKAGGIGDYLIRLVGNKLVILGSDDETLMLGVERFLKDYVTADGFAFTDTLDVYYDDSELIYVPDEMKGTLDVDFGEVINPDIIGGGVNFDFSSYVFINLTNGGEWGTGPLRSQHIPFSHSKKVADSLWEDYFDLIDQTGMQYVRLNVSFTMWEPVNDNDDPFDTDFDRGFIFSPHFSERPDAVGKSDGFPALNYAYLDAFYRLLDHFEERGLFVILANWDNGSEALGFCPDKKNWLASVDASGNQLGRGNNLNVKDLDEYAETFAAMMYHLVEEKGYTCVKGFSFYNEPENLSKAPTVLAEVYNKFGEHLDRLGIRDEVMIQAFDGSITWMAVDGGKADRITQMEKTCGDNMDLYSLHWYLSTIESGEMVGSNDVRGVISGHLIPEVERLLEQAGDKPLVLGELGTFAFQQGDGPDGRAIKDYRTRLFAAEAAIEIFNAGVKGYGLWIYNCYYHSYHTMLDFDPKDPQRIVPDKQYFYPSALIMKYLPGGTDIVESAVTGCEDSYKHVWACAGVRPDGGKSILLVNDGDDAAEITLPGGVTYQCFTVDPDHTDKIYEEGAVTDTLVMRPDSIVVLTDKPF